MSVNRRRSSLYSVAKLRATVVVLFFLAACVNHARSQSQSPTFQSVEGIEGIPLGKVNSITRDIHGVTWFSDQTNQCITSYDGTHMTRYTHDSKDPNSLGGTYPEVLAADSSGRIWIGFYGMGLDLFDPETTEFTHFHHDADDASSLGSDTVSVVLVDHLGQVWVGTNQGLDLLDAATGKFIHFKHTKDDPSSLSHDLVRAVYEDKQGTIWVGTGLIFTLDKRGGLNRLDREKGTFQRYISEPGNSETLIDNRVRAIFEDSKGNFWIGTAGDGLHTLDRKSGVFTRHAHDNSKPEKLSRSALNGDYDHITFITEDAAGQIWIGTFTNGVDRYDPSSEKVVHFGSDSGGLRDLGCWCAASYPDGLFWIGGQQANLYQVKLFENEITNVRVPNVGWINSFSQTDSQHVWLATDAGLVEQDLVSGTIVKYRYPGTTEKDDVDNVVTHITLAKSGDLVLGTLGGVNLFNKKTGSFSHYGRERAEKRLDNVTLTYEGMNSTLWVGKWMGGIDRVDLMSGMLVGSGLDTAHFNKKRVVGILQYTPTELWLCLWDGEGVERVNLQTGKIQHYMAGQSAIQIFTSYDNILWVLTTDGMYRYDQVQDEFEILENEQLLKIKNARSALEDSHHNIWVGAHSGFYKINPERNRINYFGVGAMFERVTYVSILELADGQIVLGSHGGYYGFYPDQLKVNPIVPQVRLTDFWIDNQSIAPGDHGVFAGRIHQMNEVHLKHDQNVFSFGFTVVDYSKADDKTILYKLEDYDKDWRVQGADRAYYFNVPPGKYEFRVRAVTSSNGLWQEKKVSIIISPPWWRTWWAYSSFGVSMVLAGLSLHRIQRGRVIRAERERSQEKELAQAREIEKAYRELKATQSQLVQAEKMASLGELTAGIAHEIQNPLNFVNNFSELNSELISEMKEAIHKGNTENVKTIANEIDENERKIVMHGKRADAIVKSMLQHSRKSNGQKELTDLNQLCDEYLRLSYHGLRAKDRAFNAKFETHLDPSLPLLSIIPQDFGRVILNLINNAFYAVSERQKLSQTGYEPAVVLTTKKVEDFVEIRISDNGIGIPASVKEKIFQPFFTTKPSGQGTGLGLSLAYDIVKKGHGGDLKVESTEGEGTVFTIVIPIA